MLDGYNGTVMAYGQTGTGKTYTLGRIGKDDASERGIMVRALEDILAATSASDTIEVSYLQVVRRFEFRSWELFAMFLFLKLSIEEHNYAVTFDREK